MKPERFKQFKMGDRLKCETIAGVIYGRFETMFDGCAHIVDDEGGSTYLVTPRQVIAKIVKRKKPKLEFVGYGIKIGNAKFVRVSELLMPEDTHEVWVRPINKNKGDKNGSK